MLYLALIGWTQFNYNRLTVLLLPSIIFSIVSRLHREIVCMLFPALILIDQRLLPLVAMSSFSNDFKRSLGRHHSKSIELSNLLFTATVEMIQTAKDKGIQWMWPCGTTLIMFQTPSIVYDGLLQPSTKRVYGSMK